MFTTKMTKLAPASIYFSSQIESINSLYSRLLSLITYLSFSSLKISIQYLLIKRLSFLTLALFFFCISTQTIAQTANSSKGPSYKFDNLNFEYIAPNSHYIKFNKKLVSKDALLFIMRSNPKVYFTIIAEVAGNIESLGMLEEFVISNLKSVANDISIVSSEEYAVNGLKGRFVIIDAVISNQHIQYGYWLYIHNGFVYQLMGWGDNSDSKVLKHNFKSLFSGFKLLFPNRVAIAEGKTPLGVYNDKFVTINTENTAWVKWDDYKDNYPKAIAAGELTDTSYFNIIPFCSLGNRPHDVAVNYALLNEQGIEYPTDILKENKINSDLINGNIFTYNWQSEDVPHEGRFAIVNAKTCDYLVSYWTMLSETIADKTFDSLLKNITFKSPSKSQLQDSEIVNNAELLNQAGIYYFSRKNYIDALRFFKLAAKNDISVSIYANNILETYNRIGDYPGAKSFFESNIYDLKFDKESYSWLGWIYRQLDDNKLAEKYYQMAFEQGYREDEDTLEYANILIDQKRFIEADNNILKYAKNIKDPSVVIKRSEIKRKLEDYDAAMNLINEAQLGVPLNTEFVFEKIYIAKDKKDYKTAIDYANSLVTAGHASAGAYYQKGESEYLLHWYAQAKKSFEQALTYSPDNEYILDYIKDVSSMLGQGESTSIATEITPVKFPIIKQKTNVDESYFHDFNAYYVNKVTAIDFTVNKKLKKTITRTIKLLSDQGVTQYSTIEIGFDSLYEAVYINELIVMDENGNIISQADRNDFYITDSVDEGDSDKVIHMPVANLSKYMTIRFTYTKQTLSTLSKFPFTYALHSSDVPVVNSMIYISGDIEQLAYKTFFSEKPTIKDDQLIWSSYLPVIYYDEPMSISSSNYLASVVLNAKKTNWRDLGDEYLKQIENKITISDKVKKLALALTKNKLNRNDKIMAIIDYLQQNITYKAIEFGIRGRIPNDPNTTVDLRYGDCKDHAVLLSALLNAVNIDAKLVLVNLSSNVFTDYPSLDQFDHMIVYLPDNQSGMYIDSTDKDMNLIDKAPAGLGGKYVLVLNDNKSEIKLIPDYRVEDNMINNQRDITINPGNKSLVNEHLEMTGYIGSQLRYFLKNIAPGERFNWAKGFLGQRDRRINLLSMDIENLSDNSKPITFITEYEVANTKLNNDDILFNDTAIWEYYYLLPNDVTHRRLDFEITTPLIYKANVTIHYDTDLKVENIESKESDTNNEYFSSSLDILMKKGAIIKQFELKEKSGTFTKTQYKDFRDLLNESIQLFTPHIRFIKNVKE